MRSLSSSYDPKCYDRNSNGTIANQSLGQANETNGKDNITNLIFIRYNACESKLNLIDDLLNVIKTRGFGFISCSRQF